MSSTTGNTKRRPAGFGDPSLHDGQLEPGHAARLAAQHVATNDPDANAFLEKSNPSDPLASHLGGAFVESATSGEDDEEERLDQVVEEEMGGPFVETSAQEEFAEGTDASNPRRAKREPFPTT